MKAINMEKIIYFERGKAYFVLSSIRETLLNCHNSFVGRKLKKVQRVASLCIFWTIWKAGSQKTFENAKQPIRLLKSTFIRSLLSSFNRFSKLGGIQMRKGVVFCALPRNERGKRAFENAEQLVQSLKGSFTRSFCHGLGYT